jgi:hypothetical protein
MIKLKQLLKEIKHQIIWPAPENVPDDVINVLHRIMEVALHSSTVAKDKPMDFRNIFRLHDWEGGHWVIENRKNKGIMLSYNANDSSWWAYGVELFRGKMQRGVKLDESQLDWVIKNWVK